MAEVTNIARTLLHDDEKSVEYRFEWIGKKNRRKLYLLQCLWKDDFDDDGEQQRSRQFIFSNQGQFEIASAPFDFPNWKCDLHVNTGGDGATLTGSVMIQETLKTLHLKFDSSDNVESAILVIDKPKKKSKVKQLRKMSKIVDG